MVTILDLDASGSELYELANGMYVHTFGLTLKCSSVTLRTANSFFNFVLSRETLPPSTIDLNSFQFANDDLLTLGGETSEVSQVARCG